MKKQMIILIKIIVFLVVLYILNDIFTEILFSVIPIHIIGGSKIVYMI